MSRCFVKKILNLLVLGAGAVLFALVSAALATAQTTGSTGDLWSLAPVGAKIRGFDLPLTNKQGVSTGRLRGSEAVILDRFQVKVSDLVYTSTQTDEPEIYLHLADGIYNRDTEEITTEGKIYLRRDNMEISGNKLTWDLRARRGQIHEDVRVVIVPRGQDGPGLALENTP